MQFIASLFFKSTIQNVDSGEIKDAIWEEVILFISAETESEALSKSTAIGKQESGQSYFSEKGKVVWQFVTVERIVSIGDDALSDGDELFSRFLRASEAESMLKPFD